jgi:hypothetical protein
MGERQNERTPEQKWRIVKTKMSERQSSEHQPNIGNQHRQEPDIIAANVTA